MGVIHIVNRLNPPPHQGQNAQMVHSIDQMSSLVQVMAWRRTGDKPLPELMLTQLIDAYI